MKCGIRVTGILLLIGFCSTSRAQWIQTNGPYASSLGCIAVSPDGAGGTNLFAGDFMGGVYRSTDNGTSWGLATEGIGSNVVTLAVSGTDLFAGTWHGVYRSTNNGASWTIVDTVLTNHSIGAITVSGNDIFAGTGSRLDRDGDVFISTDNGINWSVASDSLPRSWISALVMSGAKLFAGTRNGYEWPARGVFLSTDNGTNWRSVNTGLTDSSVTALAVSGTNLFAGTQYGGVFLSTDDGTSWTPVNGGLTNNHIRALAVVPNGVGGTDLFAGTDDSYAGMSSSGVFHSTNNGTSWTAVNSGLSDTTVTALAVNSNGPGGTDLLAVTGIGVFRRPLSEMVTSVQLPSNEAPQAFDLSQNYPNPFNPSTTIRYGLPERSLVTLAVFNTLGQQIATLVQGEEDAGYHEIQFDARGLASGVYLYRLQVHPMDSAIERDSKSGAGDFVQTRTSVLVR